MSAGLFSRPQVRAVGALSLANARYWSSVAPRVHRELSRWEVRARAIPDPVLRGEAQAKLEHERFNTEVAATLATLAPRRQRPKAVEAIVALQVMYDYLDGLSEQPADDPLGNSRLLFSAFGTALTPTSQPPIDYYRLHSHRDDGGYLQALVTTCRDAFAELPAAAVTTPVALRAAARCGESQTRTHAIPALGVDQLAGWATAEADGTGLEWWEYLAGAVASVLSMHALIAAAADSRTHAAEAEGLDVAYLFISAVSTLLDSLIDHSHDIAEGSHSFVAYYGSDAVRADRIRLVVARAASEAGRVPNGAHHYMTTTGVAAYYLSAAEADTPSNRSVKGAVVAELRPLIKAVLAIFRLWRLAKLIRAR